MRGREVLARLAETHPDVHEVDGTSSGELAVTGTRRVLFALVPALAEADLVPDDVRTLSKSLEDVFLAVTGRQYDPQSDAQTTGVAVTQGARS